MTMTRRRRRKKKKKKRKLHPLLPLRVGEGPSRKSLVSGGKHILIWSYAVQAKRGITFSLLLQGILPSILSWIAKKTKRRKRKWLMIYWVRKSRISIIYESTVSIMIYIYPRTIVLLHGKPFMDQESCEETQY
jgi:hypothetical protein